MKRFAIGVLAAVLVIGVGSFAMAGPYGPSVQQAQAYGGGWGYGPMMGGGYGGYGMGRGMMGWGYGPGCWGWRGAGYAPAGQPLTKESATQILQNYIARTGNPNLKLGEVTETPNTVEGKIVTKDGSLVEKIVVDKATGRMNPVF